MAVLPALVGAGALGTGTLALRKVRGPALLVDLKPVTEGFGTCERERAAVVIVTEEGIGRCYAYFYETREEADSHFKSIWWKSFSRIMFTCTEGIIGEEIRWGGPHHMPYNTIRRSAHASNLGGRVFVRADLLVGGTFGLASYHFVSDTDAFVSFEHARCSSWQLDDGTRLPRHKTFECASYSPELRTFRATIRWAPTSFCGDEQWDYEMVFDEAFTSIVGGHVHHFTPSVTDRDDPEQVLHYQASVSEKPEPGSAGCPALVYRLWRGDLPPPEAPVEGAAAEGASSAAVAGGV